MSRNSEPSARVIDDLCCIEDGNFELGSVKEVSLPYSLMGSPGCCPISMAFGT